MWPSGEATSQPAVGRQQQRVASRARRGQAKGHARGRAHGNRLEETARGDDLQRELTAPLHDRWMVQPISLATRGDTIHLFDGRIVEARRGRGGERDGEMA